MPSFWQVVIPVVAITGWAAIVLYRIYIAGRAREHMHRERMAMIERGLVPGAEADPEKFERMMDWHPSRSLDRSGHSRRKGLLLMGIGAGLAAMFYIQGDTRTVGIGALVFLMGVAFFVNAMFEARSPRPDQEQGKGGS